MAAPQGPRDHTGTCVHSTHVNMHLLRAISAPGTLDTPSKRRGIIFTLTGEALLTQDAHLSITLSRGGCGRRGKRAGPGGEDRGADTEGSG